MRAIITGPIWRRVIIAGDVLDPDYAKRLTAMVLRALGVDRRADHGSVS